jgi:ferredoxin
MEIQREKETNMSKTVYIDEEECIGCGSCVEICPEVFQMQEGEEKAEVIKPEGGPENLVQEAIDTCPVSCIHWEE